MSAFLLSQQERKKFSDWLDQDIESSKWMIQQISEIGEIAEPMISKMKQEIVASLIVRQKICPIKKGGDS